MCWHALINVWPMNVWALEPSLKDDQLAAVKPRHIENMENKKDTAPTREI